MLYADVEHTAIAARDTAKLADWYCRTLGFTVAYDNKKAPSTYFVKLGRSLIELIPASEAARKDRANADAGLSHLAVAVSDFDGAVQDLAGKGVTVESIREASGGVKVGFFRDPEGNLLQVIRRPKPL